MKIALVGGTGDIGTGFAVRWAENHEIIIGSRKADKAQESARAVLDKLEAKGMAARYRSTVDRRVVHVRLTDAGRQALQTSPGLLGDGFLAALAELPHSERLAMAEAVERLAVLMQPRDSQASLKPPYQAVRPS